MAITGKVKTLFEDEAHTEAIFPRTKTKAITNDNGENLDVVIEELKKSVSDGKSEVAGAITAKGVSTASDASFATMATNIGAIKTGSGNARPDHVLNPYTFTNDSGIEQQGTMINRGNVSHSIIPSDEWQSYTIPSGFHGGYGYVSVQPIPIEAKKVTAIFATSYTYHTDLTEYINDTIDAGGNQNKGVYLSIINVAYAKVQVSNDLVNWYDYLYTSTNGSNSGDWGTPQNVCGSNCQFRYFRCVTKGYGNGGRNYTAWGVFVS